MNQEESMHYFSQILSELSDNDEVSLSSHISNHEIDDIIDNYILPSYVAHKKEMRDKILESRVRTH